MDEEKIGTEDQHNQEIHSEAGLKRDAKERKILEMLEGMGELPDIIIDILLRLLST